MIRTEIFIGILLSASLIAQSACSRYTRPDYSNLPPEEAYLIGNVPFFPEKDHLCGPASLQALFGFWNVPVTREEIANAVFLPQIRGAFNFDLVNFARSRGFQTEEPDGSIDRIERTVRSNRPVIAFLNLGTALFPLGHYVVIIGYDHRKKELIFHSGQNEFERMTYSRFDAQWESTNRWMLILLPPGEKNG